MKMGDAEHPILYFGKLPCRGDFVRSATSPALIQSLDRWLSAGVELMADDAHWKQMYDQAPGTRFAMLGAQRTTAVVGYLLPSADASGRRFPFLVGTTLEAESALVGLSPLMLDPLWSCLAARCHKARRTDTEAAIVLAELHNAECPAPLPAAEARADYQRYLERTTLDQLAHALQVDGARLDFRQALLALGLLLQPLLSSGAQAVDKGLHLPLPAHEPDRSHVAAFWMDLVSRFLVRTQHDLSVFMPDTGHEPARLLLGFSAGSGPALHGLLDARAMPGVFVPLASSSWVEDYVSDDYGLKKLSSYLQLPRMSLAQVSASFQEAFLGT